MWHITSVAWIEWNVDFLLKKFKIQFNVHPRLRSPFKCIDDRVLSFFLPVYQNNLDHLRIISPINAIATYFLASPLGWCVCMALAVWGSPPTKSASPLPEFLVITGAGTLQEPFFSLGCLDALVSTQSRPHRQRHELRSPQNRCAAGLAVMSVMFWCSIAFKPILLLVIDVCQAARIQI